MSAEVGSVLGHRRSSKDFAGLSFKSIGLMGTEFENNSLSRCGFLFWKNHGLWVYLNIIIAGISSDPIADVFVVEGGSYPSEHTSWPAPGHPAVRWPCKQRLSLCICPQATSLDTRPPLKAGKLFPALHLPWLSGTDLCNTFSVTAGVGGTALGVFL